MFKAYQQLGLQYALIKLEQDHFMETLMPKYTVEELGGYDPLTKSQINGDEFLKNQPPWQITYINDHN